MDIGQPPSTDRKPRRGRRRLATSTALTRRFEFETLEPRVLMSGDLLPVHGSIDVPGQTAQYAFTVAGPGSHDLYFDSQTPHSSAINWTLEVASRCSGSRCRLRSMARPRSRAPLVLR